MMSHLRQAYDYDIRIRIANDQLNAAGVVLDARDIREGVVYDRSGVKVTAFDVDHAPVKPALGYRIDYAGRSVVLSGDTRVSENLIRFAVGADVLIHEVMVPENLLRTGVPPDRAQRLVAYHTTPEHAGGVFARTQPRLAMYSICARRPLPTKSCWTTGMRRGEILSLQWSQVRATRKTYEGLLELGEDLMVIEVEAKIGVRRAARSSQ